MRFILLYCLAILGLFSCQSQSEMDDSKVFRMNQFDGLSSLDPAFAKEQTNIQIVHQLFNGLVQLDDSMQVKPDIAESWTISPDGKTYTFQLRNGVYFHQNELFGKSKTRTVTAEDFAYSFHRLTDPKVASPGSWVMEKVSSIKVLNNNSLQITLKESFPPFLGLLCTQYCAVVPKEVVEHYGSDFRSHPVGTGPFYFKIWEENVKLVLRKNLLYFEKDKTGKQLPYFEAITVTFLPDKQSEFLQLIQGNIDYISGLDPSYKDELLTLEGKLNPKYQEKLQLVKNPYLNTEYLCFYLGNDKAVDVRLRQAINYGFDRKKVVQYLRNNIGIPATGGMIPVGLPSHFDNGYTYQPQNARELVESYRKEKGKLPEITLTTASNYVDICEYIQSELAKVGLPVKVDVATGATIKQAKASGKLQLFRVSWIADYPDGENYLSLFYSPNKSPNGPNYSHFESKIYDDWFKASLQETDDAKRQKLYQKMDSLMLTQAPVVPLYYDEVTLFINKKLQNFKANPINLLNLKEVRKK